MSEVYTKPADDDLIDDGRRDFFALATVGLGVFGGAAALWPFISSLNPSADTLALSSTEVDVSSLEEGQAVTVAWQGTPVFVRYRTASEIAQAEAVDVTQLRDPQTDAERIPSGKAQYLVVNGVCTHLGCVPQGQKVTDFRGDFGGYYCPCHGSHYDTSGRIRKGPAPKNLAVPPYAFTNDTTIKIG